LYDDSGWQRPRAWEFFAKTWDWKNSISDGFHTRLTRPRSEIMSRFLASFWQS
jgi:hypothetical protein